MKIFLQAKQTALNTQSKYLMYLISIPHIACSPNRYFGLDYEIMVLLNFELLNDKCVCLFVKLHYLHDELAS